MNFARPVVLVRAKYLLGFATKHLECKASKASPFYATVLIYDAFEGSFRGGRSAGLSTSNRQGSRIGGSVLKVLDRRLKRSVDG